MNCREASDMILKGEGGSALDQHLGQCPDCRALKEDLLRISAFADLPLPEVPEKLDRAILACASEQTPHRSPAPSLLFRMPVLRVAAALAVLAGCAVLTFSAMTGGVPAGNTVNSSVTGTQTVQGADGDIPNFLTDSAELDADLLALSVELDQTESDLQLMASVSTPSWYPVSRFGEF